MESVEYAQDSVEYIKDQANPLRMLYHVLRVLQYVLRVLQNKMRSILNCSGLNNVFLDVYLQENGNAIEDSVEVSFKNAEYVVGSVEYNKRSVEHTGI